MKILRGTLRLRERALVLDEKSIPASENEVFGNGQLYTTLFVLGSYTVQSLHGRF